MVQSDDTAQTETPKLNGTMAPSTGPTKSVPLSGEVIKRQRRLFDLNNRLYASGARLELDLPMICAIGGQSAGKSSVIEAISRVALPRAQKTCTRCPTEVRLSYRPAGSSKESSSAEGNAVNGVVTWSCQVSLRFEWDDSKDCKRKEVKEQKFGDPFFDPQDGEDVLCRAQRAILNPSKPSIEFESGLLPDAYDDLNFSRNVVVLDISGNECPDLTFVDLPGFVANSDGPIIEALVESYVKKDNCLILAMIPLAADLDTQVAEKFANVHDPADIRTIRVLTKPDERSDGTEKPWIERMSNLNHRGHGWFVTKQRNPTQLQNRTTFEEAKEKEKEFFKTQTPWKELVIENSNIGKRLGTGNLIEALGRLYIEKLETQIPRLQKTCGEALERIKNELQEIPLPPSTDPIQKIISLFTHFSLGLSKRLSGNSEDLKFVQAENDMARKLRVQIMGTRPRFEPKSNVTNLRHGLGYDSTFEEAQQRELEKADSIFGGFESDKKKLNLDDMRKHIERYVGRGLSFSTPKIAKDVLMREPLDRWLQLSESCFRGFRPRLEITIRELGERIFSQYQHGRLLAHVNETTRVLITNCATEALKQISHIHSLEKLSVPWTINDHYLENNREKMLKALKEASNVSVDSFEPELVVMAEVLAFFKVASKRYIDYICLSIRHSFIDGVSKNLQSTLMKSLRLGSSGSLERCEKFLAEDPKIKIFREELENSRNRLEDVEGMIREADVV